MTATLPWTTVAACARKRGLEAVAVLPVPTGLDPVPFDRMLADGIGDMGWLASSRRLRLHPSQLVEGARSLLLALLPHHPLACAGPLRRARYAAGSDYHGLLRRRLASLGGDLAAAVGLSSPGRACVDSAPVNERQLAVLAGLGWRGRNALLIRQGLGSYAFIGCLFSPLALASQHGGQGADRCGSCRVCEQRCPTAALVERRVLSERCISYLTIEHRGVIPRALAERFDGWWYGCDLCQEHCPWNRHAPPAGDARLLPRPGADELSTLLAIRDHTTFDRHFAGRAIRRLGFARFQRNLLVALWSLKQQSEFQNLLKHDTPLLHAQHRELMGTSEKPSRRRAAS